MKTEKMSLFVARNKLTKAEMKKIMGGSGSGGFGCPTYGCGAGGNGTCQSGVVDGRIHCVCSDPRGGICYF